MPSPWGCVAIGYEVDSTVAQDLARVSDSKIVLAAGDKVIASSLSPQEESEMQRLIRLHRLDADSAAQEIVLSGAEYQVASVALHDGPPSPVQCYVFVSLRRPMSFIRQLNRTILVLGISAVLFAWLLLSSVSRTITRPLDNLVAGVRALAAGDYAYSITPRGSSEVAELGEAFCQNARRAAGLPAPDESKPSASPPSAAPPVPFPTTCATTWPPSWRMPNSSTKRKN